MPAVAILVLMSVGLGEALANGCCAVKAESEQLMIGEKPAYLSFDYRGPTPVIDQNNTNPQYILVQFRLSDVSNQTYPHVTYFINMTNLLPDESAKPLIADYFHSHSGPLVLNISLPADQRGDPIDGHTGSDGMSYLFAPNTARGGPLDALVADNRSMVRVTDNTGSFGSGLYKFDVKIFGIENDTNIIPADKAAGYDFYFSMGEALTKQFSFNGAGYNVTVISYYKDLDSFTFDPDTGKISWSMQTASDTAHLQDARRRPFVHVEVGVPKAMLNATLAASNSTQYNGSVNGNLLKGPNLAVDPYISNETTWFHFLLNANYLAQILNSTDNASGKMSFALVPDNAPLEKGIGAQLAGNILKVTAKMYDYRYVYGYGETIPLNVTIFNSGNQIINLSSSDLKPYAGLGYSCAGVMYFDFLVLDGDYSKEITSYDDLLRLKEKALYVLDPPFRPHSCLLPYIQTINSVTIYPGVAVMPDYPFGDGDSRFTINYVTKTGSTDSRIGSALPYAYLREVYEGGIDNSTGRSYTEGNQLLPPGKYTVVAFTMSGQISKPLVLEVRAMPDISFIVIMGIAAIAGVTVLMVLPRYQRHYKE